MLKRWKRLLTWNIICKYKCPLLTDSWHFGKWNLSIDKGRKCDKKLLQINSLSKQNTWFSFMCEAMQRNFSIFSVQRYWWSKCVSLCRPNYKLLFRGCGLSTGAAYTWSFTVPIVFRVRGWKRRLLKMPMPFLIVLVWTIKIIIQNNSRTPCMPMFYILVSLPDVLSEFWLTVDDRHLVNQITKMWSVSDKKVPPVSDVTIITSDKKVTK